METEAQYAADPPADRKTYNGIEHFPIMEMGLAYYRTLDPGIGRWLQVDPEAEKFYGMSPYNSMGNNPVSVVDPMGDEIITAMLVGAAIGVIGNGITNVANDQNFFQNAGMAALSGAVGGAMTGGASGIALGMGKAAVGTASGYLPGYNVELGGGFGLSLSPSMFIGSQGFGIGANLSLSYSTKGFSMGISGGGTAWGKHVFTGGDFIEGRLGGGFMAGGSDFQFGASTMAFYGGDIPQRLGSYNFAGNGWSLGYENDWQGGYGLGDGGDRFRTTGLNLSVGDFSMNIHFATGDPGPSGKRTSSNGSYTIFPESNVKYHPDDYRLGSMTFGYRGYFMGINSEQFRHLVQNKFAHDFVQKGKANHFSRVSVIGSSGNYLDVISGYRTKNAYTTW